MICIPKLALEIQDLSLPATVLLPRLDNNSLIQSPKVLMGDFSNSMVIELVTDLGVDLSW